MSKELEIFKKHLGDVSGNTEFKAKELCSQINDANDFIGALQILSSALKKIHKNIQERIEQNLNNDDIQKRMLDANSAQIIQNCSFMGKALFDTTLSAYIKTTLFSFNIQNPLLVLENSDYNGVLAYIEDKKEELDTLLENVANAIALDMASDLTPSQDSFDYKSLFR